MTLEIDIPWLLIEYFLIIFIILVGDVKLAKIITIFIYLGAK